MRCSFRVVLSTYSKIVDCDSRPNDLASICNVPPAGMHDRTSACEKVPVVTFQDSDDLSRSVAHRIAALITQKAEAGGY